MASTTHSLSGLAVIPTMALFVWGYALVWFFLNDRVKLLAYRIFDPVKIKTPSDLTPQISKRAYELYEQRGRNDGGSAQDWG